MSLLRTWIGAAAAVLALTAAACSSSITGAARNTASVSSAAAASSVTSSSHPPFSAAATSPVARSASASADRLTPTNSTLRLGRTATVSWQSATATTNVATIAMTLTSVKKGAIADLKNFQLDAQTKQGVPFYITVKFVDVGAKPVKLGGIFGDITAYNGQGDAVNNITLLGDFPTCQGTPPDSLPVGKNYAQCEVYVAPAGQTVRSVVFHSFVDTKNALTETKITWTVT